MQVVLILRFRYCAACSVSLFADFYGECSDEIGFSIGTQRNSITQVYGAMGEDGRTEIVNIDRYWYGECRCDVM